MTISVLNLYCFSIVGLNQQHFYLCLLKFPLHLYKRKKKAEWLSIQESSWLWFWFKTFSAANGLYRNMTKYAFCYTLHIQQDLCVVSGRKAAPCSCSCARCENAVWCFQRCSDVPDSHSGHILVLSCGAKEEKLAEMLASSGGFKKTWSWNQAKVENEHNSLMQMQDVDSKGGPKLQASPVTENLPERKLEQLISNLWSARKPKAGKCNVKSWWCWPGTEQSWCTQKRQLLKPSGVGRMEFQIQALTAQLCSPQSQPETSHWLHQERS